MMDEKTLLRVQSFVDGELSAAEASEVAKWLAGDQQASALATELRQTRAALAGSEQTVAVPESRDFYWSKIKRQIEFEQREVPAAPAVPWLVRVRRLLMPAAGLAVAALVLMVATRENSSTPVDATTETALEDSGAFTYHDSSAGVTLVWLSYPADELANNDDSLD